MLRAQLANPHSQVACQRFLLAPVAVRGVENLGLSNHGDGEELAIRWIEPVFQQLREAAAAIVAGRNRDLTHSFSSVHVIVHVFEECISYFWKHLRNSTDPCTHRK